MIFKKDNSPGLTDSEMHILFIDNYEKIYKLALSILLDIELAKEITHESFIKAFKKFDSLNNKDSFVYWISRITKNLCMDKLREIYKYRKRHTNFSNNEDIDGIADINMFVHEIVEKNELIDELVKSISELDIPAQQIIFLRFYRGLTYKDISEILDMTESNTKITFFRAKKILFQKLKENYLGG